MTSTPVAAQAPRAFDRRHRASTVGLLALVTMFAFEAVAVSLAMPRVADALHGETLYPIAVIGMLTAAIVGMTVGGIWGDARGPAVPLSVGGVGFVVGLLVSGLAGSMEVFVLGRLVQGLGSGLALTSMYVAVSDAYPATLRPRVFSLFATAWVLPSIVGPFVAGGLVDVLGWRSVFLVVAGFALVSTVFVRLALRPSLTTRTKPLVWGRRPFLALAGRVRCRGPARRRSGHRGRQRAAPPGRARSARRHPARAAPRRHACAPGTVSRPWWPRAASSAPPSPASRSSCPSCSSTRAASAPPSAAWS